jgi:hypothetical protein
VIARTEKLYLPNGDILETPILLPSFSSKGFPDLKKIVSHLEEYLSGPFLVSAYDLNYGLIQKRIKFANKLIFVDSGGYECASIVDFSDSDKDSYRPRKWNYDLYFKTVADYLNNETPKIIISYDHPKTRKDIQSQIRSAKVTFTRLQNREKVFD